MRPKGFGFRKNEGGARSIVCACALFKIGVFVGCGGRTYGARDISSAYVQTLPFFAYVERAAQKIVYTTTRHNPSHWYGIEYYRYGYVCLHNNNNNVRALMQIDRFPRPRLSYDAHVSTRSIRITYVRVCGWWTFVCTRCNDDDVSGPIGKTGKNR